MPKIYDLQPSFNAGEFSPRLAARTDFTKHRSGCENLVNMLPLAEGGAMRRASTRYIAEVKTSSDKTRLKKFEFSTEQAYQIEMGDEYFRFYRNQAQITSNNITASISNGTFDSDLTSWSDISSSGSSISWNSDGTMKLTTDGLSIARGEQQVTNSSAIEHVVKFQVKGAPGDFAQLSIGTSSGGTQIVNGFKAYVGYHAYAFTATAANFYLWFANNGVLSGEAKSIYIDNVSLIDNSPIELQTPYDISDVFQVDGPQSADVLYLFHNDYQTHKLERRGHTTWSLVEVAWQDGPYLPMNTSATTMTPSATTGEEITVTASSTAEVNGGSGFTSNDLGRSIRIDNPSSGIDWGWGVIMSITSTVAVKVHIKRDFGSTNADTRWALGAFSAVTGYPGCGAFFEQRLFAANTPNQPQSFWASQTGDFENMTPDSDPETTGVFGGTVEDNDALDFTISADNVNAILWMSAGEDTLAIGTTGGEWTPSSAGAVLTPSDLSVRIQTTHGSAQVQPVRIDNVVLFLQKAKRKVRELGFRFESDGYQAFDMTRLAYHITYGGITEMAHAEEPNSVVYAVRADGVLLSMTYRREEDVVGWARNIIGGSFSSGNAVVDSVSSIPGTDGSGQVQDSTGRDEVWVIVKRTINGATKRYVEVFERDFEDGHDQEDSYYADSIVTYDGSSTDTITGLDHLEGETVKVLADGSLHDDKTVSSGQITLDREAAVVQVGLGYTHTLKPLKFEGGNPAGTSQGRTRRINAVTFVVHNALTLQWGSSTSDLEPKVDFRDVSDAMDTAVPYFTGEYYAEFDGDWTTDSRIVIQSNDPAPFTLLALAPEIALNPQK